MEVASDGHSTLHDDEVDGGHKRCGGVMVAARANRPPTHSPKIISRDFNLSARTKEKTVRTSSQHLVI